jgi:hypothetical protein
MVNKKSSVFFVCLCCLFLFVSFLLLTYPKMSRFEAMEVFFGLILITFFVLACYALVRGVVQARWGNKEKEIKCISCNKKFRGKNKLTLLGFKKYTCTECNHKNFYPLTKNYLILYWLILVIFFIFYLHDLIQLFSHPFLKIPPMGLGFWVIMAGFSLTALIKNRMIKRSRTTR